MSDLIDRRAAIEKLRNNLTYMQVFGVDRSIVLINELPSAQPERKAGKWKRISPAGIYECSLCGQNVMTDDIEAYSFCHGCGAKMEVSE